MSQETDQLFHSDHHTHEKLDEISSPPSAESSVEHEEDGASSLNQAQSRILPADGSSGDDPDVDHLLEDLAGNHASSDDDDDANGEDDSFEESDVSTDDDDDDDNGEDDSFEKSDDSTNDDDDNNGEDSSEESDDCTDDDHYYDRFDRDYRCFPLSSVDKKHLEIGNKIIMPADALMRLMDTKISMPMQFEIQNQSTGKVSHCGVLEFTAEDESAVYLPDWMMKNMQLQAGDLMTMKNKDLEKGTCIKLQPHSSDFLGISNLKDVLEENLQKFSCLTMGDTIMISHWGKSFYINIVETQPSSAISIIDTDCNVDFAPPLDYKEPAKSVSGKEKEANEKPKFKPFTGLARRLVESTSTELNSASHGENEVAAEAEGMSKRSPLGLVLETERGQPQNRGKELKNQNVEAEASTAISIVNTDCNVDFAPPLDDKKTEKCVAKSVIGKEKERANERPKFKPFKGLARRLVEPTSTELDSASHGENEAAEDLDSASHGENEAAEAECTSKRSPQGLLLESERSCQRQNRGKELKNENVEAEASKDKPKFQPFSGKKYTLAE